MAIKASYRNQRGGTSANHNDRTNTKNSDHIDQEKMMNNIILVRQDGKLKQLPAKYQGQGYLEQLEIKQYDILFAAWLKEANEKKKRERHANLIKDMKEIYKSCRYAPMETILQLGSLRRGDIIQDSEKLVDVIDTFSKQVEEQYGANYKILSVAVHCDESSLHAHVRGVYIDSERQMPAQEKALEQMGFERPNLNQPSGRYNNRLITQTNKMREMFYDCIRQELNIEVDNVIANPESHARKSLLQYQNEVLKEKNKLYEDQLLKYMTRYFNAYNNLQKVFNHFFNAEQNTYLKIVERIKPTMEKAQAANNNITQSIQNEKPPRKEDLDQLQEMASEMENIVSEYDDYDDR